jgi:hypothetical protein
LAAQADASEVSIHPTITGYAEHYTTSWPPPDSWYNKFYGDIRYGGMWAPHYRYDYYAFLKFSLDSLPDSCTILQAELGYYQYDSYEPQVDVGIIRDPVPLNPYDLLVEIRDAPAITPIRVSPDGWVTLAFDTASFFLLDSCRHTGWSSFGLRSAGNHFGFAYGYDSSLSPYLRITYLGVNETATDIQALRAELATYPLGAQQPDTALLILANKGLCTSGPFWAYASSPSLASDSALVEPIAVGETASIRIPLPSPSSRNVVTGYRLWASDDNDWHHDNDSTQLQCWSFPPSTYTAEGFDGLVFPPPGWLVVNSDSGTQGWERQANTWLSHSGEGFASCASEPTGTSDDWLICGPVCPGQEYRDSVGFFVRGTSWLASDTLEVLALSGRYAPASLLLLAAHDVSYSRRSVSLDASDGDTIKVAFRYRSSIAGSGFYLDDVWFSRIFAPDTGDTNETPEPPRDVVQRTSTKLPGFSLAPNPVNDRAVTVRCALTVGKRRRVTLRDVTGRAVRAFVLDPSGISQLDLRGFTPGVYLASLDGTIPPQHRKLVVTSR